MGGKSIMWGRQSYRWSDLDFGANARDGHGIDWPIRYKDIAPWYDYVERHAGISGEKGYLNCRMDNFLPPMEMNCVERAVKKGIEGNSVRVLLAARMPAWMTRPGRALVHFLIQKALYLM